MIERYVNKNIKFFCIENCNPNKDLIFQTWEGEGLPDDTDCTLSACSRAHPSLACQSCTTVYRISAEKSEPLVDAHLNFPSKW